MVHFMGNGFTLHSVDYLFDLEGRFPPSKIVECAAHSLRPLCLTTTGANYLSDRNLNIRKNLLKLLHRGGEVSFKNRSSVRLKANFEVSLC